MSLSEELEVLRNIPMFANVESAQLKLLAFTSERLTFEPGQDLANVIAEMKGRGLICVLPRVDLARAFDRVAVMRAGRIVEQGGFAELSRDGTYLSQLLQAA